MIDSNVPVKDHKGLLWLLTLLLNLEGMLHVIQNEALKS